MKAPLRSPSRRHLPTAVFATLGLLTAACSCGDKDANQPPPLPRDDGLSGRVQAIKAKPAMKVEVEDFCASQSFDGGFEPPSHFEWPDLVKPAPAGSPRAWRWINFWATWCKPCVEEMPTIERVRGRLAEAGIEVDLLYVSADADDATVAAFQKSHPKLVEQTSIENTLRLTNPDILEAWLLGYGLTNPGLLPVHTFVDPTGTVRCMRMTSVGEDVYPVLHEMMGG